MLTVIAASAFAWTWFDAAEAVDVDAGDYASCAATSCGDVVCWGYDGTGIVSDAPSGGWDEVTVGAFHACARDWDDGSVTCWGADWYGQASPPAQTFSQISAGAYHTCGVTWSDELVCWGYDGFGQDVSGASRTLTGSLGFGQVDGGYYHTVVLEEWYDDQPGYYARRSGSVWAQGDYGRDSTFHPPDVLGARHYANNVTGGFAHSCAEVYDYDAYRTDVMCWGSDSHGQLSGADSSGQLASSPIEGLTRRYQDGGGAYRPTAGWYHTCALVDDRWGGVQAACWGDDSAGQSTPSWEMTVGTASDVSAGGLHGCGIIDGRAYCWGSNAYGQAAVPDLGSCAYGYGYGSPYLGWW